MFGSLKVAPKELLQITKHRNKEFIRTRGFDMHTSHEHAFTFKPKYSHLYLLVKKRRESRRTTKKRMRREKGKESKR